MGLCFIVVKKQIWYDIQLEKVSVKDLVFMIMQKLR